MTLKREDPRFRKYATQVDLERLRAETDKLMWQPDINRYKDQISLQTDGSDNWDSATGSRVGQNEAQWDKLHPSLVGTWWEDFFASIPFKVYRARLMTLHPRTCYSIHVDDHPRIHIAIKTHRQAKFIFTSPTVLKHIPDDGHIWWVDTRYEHSAMNGHTEARIHFVAALVNTTTD